MIVTCGYLEMNVKELMLVCDCDDSEIELAERGFNAVIVKVDTERS